jgi:PAS domain S-box-containing protein
MKLSNTWAIVLFVGISIGVFVIDMIMPLGFAAWTGYLIPLTIIYWLLKPEETYVITIGCSVFIIVAFFYSPRGLTEELAVINRIIAIGVLWQMAYMIEKRKKAEKAAAFHSDILARINEPVFAFDLNYKIIYWNKGSENLYQIPASDAIGKDLYKILRFRWLKKNDETDRKKALKENGEWKGSVIHHRKDGEEVLVESTTTTLLNKQGDKMGYLAVIYDITERTTKDAIIKKDLLEKEILLREIHHRVKNNMQIISSLLNLQTQSLTDEKSIRSLEDSQARIRAMSLVHEKLYAAADIKQVDFEAYIRDLISVIVKLYRKNTDNIEVDIKIEDFPIEPDTVIILGLIINEFLSNSFKYAFPDGQRGKIFISLKNENPEIKLIFSDNGIGIPEEIDFRNTNSLGLQIVNALASQLKGEIKLNRNSGTEFILSFEDKPAKQYYTPSNTN